MSVSADEDGVGGILARGPRGGRYNDEEAGYAGAETGHRSSRTGVQRDGTEEEGRVLVGGDSDDEDDNTTVWQHGGAANDEEGIVLAGSDDEDDDDENHMTANEIRDRRSA